VPKAAGVGIRLISSVTPGSLTSWSSRFSDESTGAPASTSNQPPSRTPWRPTGDFHNARPARSISFTALAVCGCPSSADSLSAGSSGRVHLTARLGGRCRQPPRFSRLPSRAPRGSSSVCASAVSGHSHAPAWRPHANVPHWDLFRPISPMRMPRLPPDLGQRLDPRRDATAARLRLP
jgi:hypothetical protein